jgi:hypothetical protein
MDKTIGIYILFRWLVVVLPGLAVVLPGLEPSQDNRQPSTKNNKYQLLYPYGVPPDDGL